MYAKITNTKNIRKALNYNELKIKEGKAECLCADNYIKDLSRLTSQDKLDRFIQRISLNERSHCNVVHISLNFDPKEEITNQQMLSLSREYMQGMGLSRQPYLVYRHYDSAHPHVHIVSTNIRADGSRMNAGPAFCHHSRELTNSMEKKYSLIHYEKAAHTQKEKFNVRQAQRVVPGESGLKYALSNVLSTVINQYKYTSLSELNAALGLYNVKANPGSPASYIYQHKGLLYHALDENGNKIGRAIKASDFFQKPTLAFLENRFSLNEGQRDEQILRVKFAIDWSFAGRAPDWEGLKKELEKEQISIVLQKDKQAGTEELFFVDHENKAVCTGLSLGNDYSLSALKAKCAPDHSLDNDETQRHRHHLDL